MRPLFSALRRESPLSFSLQRKERRSLGGRYAPARTLREGDCDCCCAKGSLSRSSARRIQLDGANVTGLQLCTQTVITRLRLVPVHSAITMLTNGGCWGYKLVISLLLHPLRSSSSSSPPPPLGTGG